MRTVPFLALVPLAYLALLWLLIVANGERLGFGRLSIRGALVVAYVAFEATVVLVTEASSYGHRFDSTTVASAWGLLTVFALVLARRCIAQFRTRTAVDWIRGNVHRLSAQDRLWIGLIVGALGVLSAIAWLYPPNNADSMVYHLPRVVHWIQDRSVAHFATHYLAQIELSPLHEYNLAHVHLLAGSSDRLDGFVQLLAMAICIVAVSEIARALGASRRGQVLASVLAATIPTGILESTSTQNNYFAASIGAALLVTLFSWHPEKGWAIRAVTLGLGIGLAILAKGTLPALIAPALVVLALLVLSREVKAFGVSVTVRRTVAVGLIAGSAAIALCGPFLLRNVELFGSPTGPVSQTTISTHVGLDAGFGNVIRSTAADFWIGNGRTGFEAAVSRTVLKGLNGVYSHLQVSPGDQRYALGTNRDAFKVQDYSSVARSENFGANPWHVVLLVATGIALAVAVVRRARWPRTAFFLAVGLAAGYVLFTYTARWSAFSVRYQLPLLVAWCPLVALVLDRCWRFVGVIVLIGLTVASLPALVDNLGRPLIHPAFHFSSELSPYLLDARRPGLSAAEYENVTRGVAQSGCKHLGLANWILFEYPIWAGLRDANWGGRIEHVGVMNQSRTLERRRFRPCAEVQEVADQYAGPDNGDLHMRFGKLALSIEASRLRVVRVRAPGFSSTASGLRLLPGGGWALTGPRHAPILEGTASLFLYSATPRDAQLTLTTAPGSATRLLIDGPRGEQQAAADAAGVITIKVRLPGGTTRLRLATVPTAGMSNQLPLTKGITATDQFGRN